MIIKEKTPPEKYVEFQSLKVGDVFKLQETQTGHVYFKVSKMMDGIFLNSFDLVLNQLCRLDGFDKVIPYIAEMNISQKEEAS